MKCHGRTFGRDVAPHFRKQCFCETKPRKEPYICAKEGQACKRCNGVIFYGVRMINGHVSNIEEMMNKNYRYKEHYNNGN